VCLWDVKYRGKPTALQPSKTFSVAQRRANAIQQAIDTLTANTTLSKEVRDKAIDNLERKTFKTRTVGWGEAKNSTLR
jgi:hypothetical protein